MADTGPSQAYLAAIRRAFRFAQETGSGCGPVHFLVGIAEGDGPAAAALAPADGRSLRAVVLSEGDIAGRAPAAYLHMQAQGGARSLAAARGQQPAPEHLLVALIDQSTPEVAKALGRARLDAAAVRRAALAAMGAPADQPAIAFGPGAPAGTLDRPPLPVGDLDPRAWSALRWRQEHLPIARLHRRWDTEALIRLERDVVFRLAGRLGLDDDQRFSLTCHHEEAIDERVRQAKPDLGRPDWLAGPRTGPGAMLLQPGRLPGRYRHPRGVRRLTVGWGVWFSNRRVQIWNRWFRLRLLGAYRDAPQP